MLVEILISLWDSGKLVFNEVKIISLQIANFKMKKKKKEDIYWCKNCNYKLVHGELFAAT